jgi:acyl-coenzyme A thioesterase 9
MGRAFELAFSTAYAFAGAAPHFLEVDHVDFFKPVSNQGKCLLQYILN